MKTLFLLSWVSLPLLFAAFHYGPGQDLLKQDAAQGFLETARACSTAGDNVGALHAYEAALQQVPAEQVVKRWPLRLEHAKTQMLVSQLPKAREGLEQLVQECQGDPRADEALRSEARLALANAQFYMTWLMRLEGQAREVWVQEAEAARQNFRLLAEDERDPSALTSRQEDLAASVRLARMDLADLQGLPLPSQ